MVPSELTHTLTHYEVGQALEGIVGTVGIVLWEGERG